MAHTVESHEIVRAVCDSRVSESKQFVTEILSQILNLLKDYPESNFGIGERMLMEKLGQKLPVMCYEIILMILAKLCEKRLITLRRQQIGTAGITDIFYNLAEGVQIGSTPMLTSK